MKTYQANARPYGQEPYRSIPLRVWALGIACTFLGVAIAVAVETQTNLHAAAALDAEAIEGPAQ